MLALPDHSLSDEQADFRASLRRFFEAHCPMSVTREAMAADVGTSRTLWRRACDELALPGIAIDESAGGQGFGLAELAIAISEAGRALAPIPLFGVAGWTARIVAAVADDASRRDALTELATGECAALAPLEVDAAGRPVDRRSRVDASGRVSGQAALVLDADVASRFVVVASATEERAADAAGLWAVDGKASGASIQRVETLDPTRRLFVVRFEDAPAQRLSDPHSNADFARLLARGTAEATALLCAEMVGGMQRVLETAVEHASTRYQFGRAVGSFQAIKHKAADMLIDFESARTATSAAIEALDSGDAEAPMYVAVAKAMTSAAFVRMATESLQIQGGVGYTWEYDAHLFFRRAHSSAALLGDPERHERWLARYLAERVDAEASA